MKQRDFVISNVLLALNKLNTELNEYNASFWSKILINFWLIYSSFIILVLYNSLFTSMDIIVKLIYDYVCILFVMLFLFVIFTASSVNSEANKSYKLLNQLMAINVRHNYISLRYQIKVIILLINIETNI